MKNPLLRTMRECGFTLIELIVTFVIMGVLAGVVVPVFSELTEQTQAERNRANLHIIRETFFQYYYRQHMRGNPHFPNPSTNENRLMDDAWANAPIADNPSETPGSLFSDGKVPRNSMDNPFSYDVTFTYDADSVATPTIILQDVDPVSPTFNTVLSYSP